MTRATSRTVCALAGLGLLISGGCGGGSDGGPIVQVPATVTISPSSVVFGAIGSSRQLSVTVKDSNGAVIASPPAATWARAGSGATATVSASGLVSAVGVGSTDTAVATVAGISAKAAITVSQVVASITVGSTGIDSLKNTGSTKAYTAAARDSNNNPMAAPTVTWSSSNTAVATVDPGTGVATAVGDGSANITATAGNVNGFRALQVRRFAKTFSISPNTTQAITTNAGTITFTGVAQDSTNALLTIVWTSNNSAALTMVTSSGTSGSTSDAKGAGNGAAYVVLSGGLRKDSTLVNVSGQTAPPPPLTASVSIGDDFFKSAHNNGQNPAVDTVAVGGTVQWTWAGAIGHNVTSGGSPTFTPSPSATQATGTFSVTFNSAGTYQYFCSIHGLLGSGMFGTVVVR